MNSVLLEGPRSFHLAGPVRLIDTTKEVAWEAARQHIVVRPDFAWLMSSYVSADPGGNQNGHIFGLDDLRANHSSVVHTSLNMGHHSTHIMGQTVASELIYPAGDGTAATAANPPAAAGAGHPFVETLAVFWKKVWPDEFADLTKAHAEGASWISMECVPEALKCMTVGGCGLDYAYDGTQSGTYCEELNAFKAPKQLLNPHFIGSGLVLPPMRPGWRQADVTEISALIEANVAQAERLYAEIETAASHLDPKVIEDLMIQLLDGAFGPVDSYHPRKKMKARPKTMADLTPAELLAATTALAVERAAQNGVIVALVPPPEIAAVLAGLGSELAEQLHVTVAFLGETDEAGLLDGRSLGEVTAALAVFAAGAPELGEAIISGVGYFLIEGDSVATYASVDVPSLPEFRARLVAGLEAAGIPVAHNHGSSPHITLRYGPPGGELIVVPEGLSWDVEAIELWWGDANHQRFELSDGRVAFAP